MARTPANLVVEHLRSAHQLHSVVTACPGLRGLPPVPMPTQGHVIGSQFQGPE